jgi:hypothetical protein
VSDDKRRDIRYPARVLVQVVRRGDRVELLTNDVSYRGAFLRTDAPPALRQLVKVSVSLPLPLATNVDAHAMVVRVVEPNGRELVPGVGVQFWGPIGQQKAWDQFIQELRVREKAGMPAARATDKVRRASERFKLQLDVDLGGKRGVTRDLSETGMAIRTDAAMTAGMRVQCNLLGAGSEKLAFDVVVRRRIVEAGFTGLGVEFADATPEARQRIVRLIRASVGEEDAIFIDPDDPGLH